MSEADTKAADIEATLRRRVEDINEASEKAARSAGQIRETLQGQVQGVFTMAGQIAGHGRSINETMTTRKDALSAQVRESLDGIEKVREALERQTTDLGRLLKGAVHDVEKLERVIGRCTEIGQATTQTIKALESLDDTLETRITTFKDRAERAEKSFTDIGSALRIRRTRCNPRIRGRNHAGSRRPRDFRIPSGHLRQDHDRIALASGRGRRRVR